MEQGSVDMTRREERWKEKEATEGKEEKRGGGEGERVRRGARARQEVAPFGRRFRIVETAHLFFLSALCISFTTSPHAMAGGPLSRQRVMCSSVPVRFRSTRKSVFAQPYTTLCISSTAVTSTGRPSVRNPLRKGTRSDANET